MLYKLVLLKMWVWDMLDVILVLFVIFWVVKFRLRLKLRLKKENFEILLVVLWVFIDDIVCVG